jgi:hypothetical protein
VSYKSVEDLLVPLRKYAPATSSALAQNRRRVEHGLLSVGLKIHCLDRGEQFFPLIQELGGAQTILEINRYKRDAASLCWVLPPVGSATAAIQLLECIEEATGSAIFHNSQIQIQVCSPKRLGEIQSALLSIGFYLASDVIQRFTLGDFATTFSEDDTFPRGRRIVLYDASGHFDRAFEWWERRDETDQLVLRPNLPFSNGRTDILAATSRLDIRNINLLSSLLVHIEQHGYWQLLGMQFENEMIAILERHMLKHLLAAPWIRTDDKRSADDNGFIEALRELMAYAFEDVASVTKKGESSSKPESPEGILWDMTNLLQKYRREIIRQSRQANEGGKNVSRSSAWFSSS